MSMQKLDSKSVLKISNTFSFMQARGSSIKIIELPGIVPDEVSYSYSPNFQEYNVLGRMSPIFLYKGGSSREYSFSLTVHEDSLSAIGSEYNTIVELVDDLKSLMYPEISNDGIVSLKKVMFSIGNISGRGIVTISHSWKKPFRDGHFIMVDLSFKIIAETIFPEIQVLTPKADDHDNYDYSLVAYSNIVTLPNGTVLNDSSFITPFTYSGYIAAEGDYYTLGYEESIYNKNFDQSTSHLVSSVASKEYIAAREAYAENYFDVATTRLNTMLSLMSTLDSKNKDLHDLVTSINELSSIDLGDISLKDNETLDSLLSRHNKIKDIKDTFSDYLDYYYDEVNKDMTPAEKQAILDEFFGRLEALEDIYEEVSGYAAGN